MSVPRLLRGLDQADAARFASGHLALLEELIETSGADDAALERGLAELAGGAEGAVELVAYGMTAAFRPQEADGESGRVQLLLGPDGTPDEAREFEVCLEIAAGSCRVVECDDAADSVIRISTPTFLRIAFKFLDGNDAYLAGLTDLTGDVFLATNLDQWFDVPSLVDYEAVAAGVFAAGEER
jgi:hypothetical protein